MRLLAVTTKPEGAGFRQRIGVYLDILRDSGVECEVATLPPNPLHRRELFRRAVDFDGVFLYKKKLSCWDAWWLRKYSRKIIYSFDDAIMYKDRRPEVYSRSHFVPFRRTVRLADRVIVGSEYLAEHARRFNSHVDVLPLGLPVDDYTAGPLDPQDGKVRFVWIGSKSTLDYLRRIQPVLEEIAARFPGAVLRIISDDFLEPRGMAVEKLPWSKENRRVGLATSDIGLAPLPDDPFTRGKCSFKVLEYSASGLPVIASPVGTNADHVIEGVTGFLVSEDTEWLDRAIRLIEDPELRRRMGAQGKIQAARHDARLIGPRLAAILHDCLERKSSPVPPDPAGTA